MDQRNFFNQSAGSGKKATRKPVRPAWQTEPIRVPLSMEEINRQLSRKKRFWKERSSSLWSFYCPLCRSQRRVPYRPQPGGWRHFAQVGLTAAFFTLLTWQWFTWKGIVSFVPLWIAFETIYRSQVRKILNCSNCGFDPYLYLLDLKSARAEIEAHWRKKFAEKGIPYPENSPEKSPAPAASAPLDV